MKKLWKKMVLVLVVVLGVSMLAGCGNNAGEEKQKDTQKDTQEVGNKGNQDDPETEPKSLTRLGLAIPSTALFFEAEANQAKKFCDENGIELITVIADNDATKQHDQIEDLISKGCEAIVIVQVDKDAILSSLESCKEAGVYTICCGRQPADMTNCDVFVSANNEKMCEMAVESMLEGADVAGIDKLKVVEFVGKLSDQNAVERDDYFKQYAEASGRIEIVAEVASEWNQDTAYSRFSDVYNSLNGDFNAIYLPADSYITAAASVLQENNDWGSEGEENYRIITGIDGSSTAYQYIMDGYMYSTINSDAHEFINASINAAMSLVAGETCDDVVEPVLLTVRNQEIEEYGDKLYGIAYMDK